MRVIDAFTGKDVCVGDSLVGPNGKTWTLVGLDDRWLRVTARIETEGHIHEVPLQVRFFHPLFFMQRIAFVPS